MDNTLSSKSIQEAIDKLKQTQPHHNEGNILCSRFAMLVMFKKDKNITIPCIKQRIRKLWSDYQIIYTPYRKHRVKDNKEYQPHYIESKSLSTYI